MRRQITPDELSYLFQRIGKAVWHLQYVEEALSYFYFIKGILVEPHSISEEDAKKTLKETQRETLGSLLRVIERENLINDLLLLDLKRLNNERRWLIHKALIENGDDLYTNSGRRRVFDRVENFIHEAVRLQKQVSSETSKYYVSKGLSEAWINSTARNEIRRLKGETE